MTLNFDQRAIVIQLVNSIFKALMAINPAFRQAWPTEEEFLDTKMQWVLAFMDKGLVSVETVDRGLKRIRSNSSPFVPSPGQFIEMCKATPEDLGAPSIELAYDEACKKSHPSFGSTKNWTHHCVQVASQIYGREIHQGTIQQTKDRFKQIYLDVCEQYNYLQSSGQLENSSKELPPSDSVVFDLELPEIPERIGKYEFSVPGILKQQEDVKTRDEAMLMIGNLLGSNNPIFKQLFGDCAGHEPQPPSDRRQNLTHEQLTRYWKEHSELYRVNGLVLKIACKDTR